MSTALPKVTRDGSVSIASIQERHGDRGTETAAVSLEDALSWATNNRMKPTGNDTKDLQSINRMRAMLKLPAFSVIAARGQQEPLPAPSFGGRIIEPLVIKIPKDIPMATAIAEETSHIAATSKRLRDILFQELVDLRAGKSNPQQASAVAKIAHQIIAGVRMEMDFNRMTPPTIEGDTTKLLGG